MGDFAVSRISLWPCRVELATLFPVLRAHLSSPCPRVQAHRDELDLARRRIRSLGGRADSRPVPFRAVRLIGLRRHSVLQHPSRSGNLSFAGPPAANDRLREDLSDGSGVLAR